MPARTPDSAPSSASPAVAGRPAAGAWRQALRHPSFALGTALSLLLVLAALLSFFWTPGSPYDMDMDVFHPVVARSGMSPERLAALNAEVTELRRALAKALD